MMLPSFPVPVADEIYSSVVARHLVRCAGSKARNIQILGLQHRLPCASAPHDLDALCEIMPVGHPWHNQPEALLLGNTVVPLHLYFTSKVKREETLNKILDGHRATACLGIGARGALHTAPLNAKHCPTCVKDDLAAHGHSVAYRQHQPSFIKVCAKHEEILRFNCIKCMVNRLSQRWRIAGICTCGNPQTPEVIDHYSAIEVENWLWLSRAAAYILSGKSSLADIDPLTKLRQGLDDAGFVFPNGNFNRQKICNHIVEIFGVNALTEMGLIGRRRDPADYLGHFSTQTDTIQSVAKLLVISRIAAPNIQALSDVTVAGSRMAKTSDSKGFKSLLRPTVASKAAITEALAATNNQLRKSATLLNISFENLVSDMAQFNIPHPMPNELIERLGQKKIDRIISLLKKCVPRRRIATVLTVGLKDIGRVELAYPKLRTDRHNRRFNLLQNYYRDTWKTIRKRHPTANYSELRKYSPKCVNWLTRHDKEWLDAQPKAPRKVPFYYQHLLKWEDQDKRGTDVITAFANAELSKSSKPIRLTKMLLLKAADLQRGYNPNITCSKYPKAYAAAVAFAEDTDTFHKRLLAWAMIEFKKTNQALTQQKLLKISPAARNLEKFKPYIQELARKHDILISSESALY